MFEPQRRETNRALNIIYNVQWETTYCRLLHRDIVPEMNIIICLLCKEVLNYFYIQAEMQLLVNQPKIELKRLWKFLGYFKNKNIKHLLVLTS